MFGSTKIVHRIEAVKSAAFDVGFGMSKSSKRGRPRKNGVRQPYHLARAVIILEAYTRARERGEKYIIAVEEAMEAVRAYGLAVSVAEVKRTLAEFRSQGGAALVVTQRVSEGDDAARFRSMLQQIPGFVADEQSKGLPKRDPRRPLKVFTLKFTPRPEYPRSNAKTSCSLK
jgi:hypothetical protein